MPMLRNCFFSLIKMIGLGFFIVSLPVWAKEPSIFKHEKFQWVNQEPVEIRSERMELDLSDGSIRFSGNVLVAQHSLSLKTNSLLIKTSKNGTILYLQAEGQVHIQSNDWSASAERMEFEDQAKELRLTGNPRVKQGKNTISGQSLRILLEEERIVVEKAAATLQIESSTSAAPSKP